MADSIREWDTAHIDEREIEFVCCTTTSDARLSHTQGHRSPGIHDDAKMLPPDSDVRTFRGHMTAGGAKYLLRILYREGSRPGFRAKATGYTCVTRRRRCKPNGRVSNNRGKNLSLLIARSRVRTLLSSLSMGFAIVLTIKGRYLSSIAPSFIPRNAWVAARTQPVSSCHLESQCPSIDCSVEQSAVNLYHCDAYQGRSNPLRFSPAWFIRYASSQNGSGSRTTPCDTSFVATFSTNPSSPGMRLT